MLTDLWLAVLYGLVAGAMIPAGAYIAKIERIRPRWLETEFRHSVIAFGGGVLIAAVAVVLIPEGTQHLSPISAFMSFAAGGLLFAYLERPKSSTRSHPQLLAMVTDFVPEAIALGAMMATDPDIALLLAILIALQNLPEAFNAYREMAGRKQKIHGKMGFFFLIGLIGPVACAVGYLLLTDYPEITAVIMLAAAGGILFIMFQDIAPKAHLKNRTAPSVAAVAGFGLALLGTMIVSGA